MSAVVLGVRLALRTSPAGRLRALMVAVASAVGTVTILSVFAVVAADRTINPDRYADGGVERMATAVVAVIALQVAGLAAVAGRLSAAMRSRRLSNLRLLGLTAARTRVVAAVEVAVSAIGGTLIGLLLFPAVRPLLARLRLGNQTWPAGALTPSAATLFAVPIGVAAATVLLAVLPERLAARRSLDASRRATDSSPSWWRVIPLVVGIALCLYVRTAQPGEEPTGAMLAGVLLLGIGTVLVVPIFVRLIAALMVRSSGRPALLIAGRRLQAQPAAINRVITGLLLGLFLVVGARSVVVAFEGTNQYLGAKHQVTMQQRIDSSAAADDVNETVARIAATPGVRQVIAIPVLQSACDSETGPCLTGVVATCQEFEALVPAANGCRDGQPMWLRRSRVAATPAAIEWSPVEPGPAGSSVTVTTPTPKITMTYSSETTALTGEVLIPPSSPGIAHVINTTQYQITVLGGPGRDLGQRLYDAGLVNGPEGPWPVAEYDYVVMLRTTVYTVASVVLGVGLLAFAIAATDRAISRRGELTSLRLVGLPASTLRRTQWIEALVPIVGGSLLAILLGHLAGATYLSFGGDGLTAPLQPTLVLLGVAAVGGVIVAGLTVIATNQSINPDTIRAE